MTESRAPRPREEDFLLGVDIMNWNICCARLPHVLQGLQTPPGLVLLQEVRVAAETTWQNSHGYKTHFQERGKKETRVSISVRQDILKKHNIDIDIIERTS